MRKIFLLIMAFIFLPKYALADVFDYPITDIKEITENVYIPSKLSGDFIQKKEIREVDITLSSSGKFVIDKNKGIKWEMLKPYSNLVIIEDGKLCMIDDENTQLVDSQNNQVLKHVITIMQSLLVQNYDNLVKYFDIFFIKKENGFEIGLKTTDSTIAAVFSHLEVRGKKYIEEVVLLNNSNDKTTIIFSNIIEKTEDFSCDKK